MRTSPPVPAAGQPSAELAGKSRRRAAALAALAAGAGLVALAVVIARPQSDAAGVGAGGAPLNASAHHRRHAHRPALVARPRPRLAARPGATQLLSAAARLLPGAPEPLRRPPPALAATLPFPFPRTLRSARIAEALPSLYADGLACSVGCRPLDAVDGWPLRPFHEQHPLRAALNELRPGSLHVALDIQAPDGAAVFALQPGIARVLAPSGPDARVQVGDYVYWHITPAVRTGQPVIALRTELGRVMPGYGHVAFSEVDPAGRYVNPLRPGGRVLTPWVDRLSPVIGRPAIAADGTAVVAAYDPQSFVRRTTYRTPVLAPAAIAYRLYDRAGIPVTGLEFAFRGTHLLPWLQRREIFAPGARAPGFSCFARMLVCRPDWRYWLAGGLAPHLPVYLPRGRYRLTVYAWDWADNPSALDTTVWMTTRGWRPLGHVPPPPSPAYLGPPPGLLPGRPLELTSRK